MRMTLPHWWWKRDLLCTHTTWNKKDLAFREVRRVNFLRLFYFLRGATKLVKATSLFSLSSFFFFPPAVTKCLRAPCGPPRPSSGWTLAMTPESTWRCTTTATTGRGVRTVCRRKIKKNDVFTVTRRHITDRQQWLRYEEDDEEGHPAGRWNRLMDFCLDDVTE